MTSPQRFIFSGMQTLSDHQWEQDKAIVVEGEIIKAILPKDMVRHHLPAKHYEFPADHYLVPGLIDLHIHGAGGSDVMDASEDACKTISHALAAEGVTGYLATTMTAGCEQITEVLKAVAKAMPYDEGAAILGVHLEGPFIARTKKGAQRDAAIQLPDLKWLSTWQEAAEGAIKIVTLAPELPGAMALIQLLHTRGIIPSIGHTNATYEETLAAISAGCTQATHLFNAMSELHQRRPGAAAAILLSEAVTAELIVDGVHVHPAMVELAYYLKGKDRLLLVSDAMRAKCLGDGCYDLGGQMVEVCQGKVMLPDGRLAGSILKLPEAIRNMARFAHCSLAEAIRMATANPARVLGLENKKGSISVGKDADLVILNSELEVVMTIRAGKEIYRRK